MGWGDEILVTGEARRAQMRDPRYKVTGVSRKVRVLDRRERPRWHALWQGNPRMVMPHESGDFIHIKNAAFCRPYVDWELMKLDFAKVHPGHKFTTKAVRDIRLPWRFTKHKCERGELYLDIQSPQGYVVIEPHIKNDKSPNRQWGWENWQAVVDALSIDWVQINPPSSELLRGVRHLPAPTFLEACRLLGGAVAFVGPEGGLYHAAAALGVKAVAIFGGFVSPANQGYDDMINIFEPMGGESPCGQRIPCEHCDRAFARISVDQVVESVKEVLG